MATSILLILLGAVVMIAWQTQNIRLIQVDPAYVPMQYNTALAFLLAGTGFAAIAFFGAARIGMLCGALISLLGMMTLGEYLFAVDLHIDQLLMRHYITVKTSSPGRMAPNTAFCFSLGGLALALYGYRPNGRNAVRILSWLGALILGLSLVAISGYWMSIPTAFGWGALTKMAIHTAAGFFTFGTGLLSLAWHHASQQSPNPPSSFSIPIAIGIMTITILLWQALQMELANTISHERISYNLLLAFGAVQAMAFAWAINRSHAARLQARTAAAAQTALERDIAARELTEAALMESEARFRSLFEHAAIGIARISLDSHFLQINQEFCRITGYQPEELMFEDMTYSRVVCPEDFPASKALRNEMLESSIANHSLEKRYVRKDGSIAWVYLSTSLLCDSENRPLYFINAIQDITERKRLQAEIERQAHTDFLTGLANRRYFMEQAEIELARAIRYRSPLSITMMDIDYFKRINDTYGHKVGDTALQKLSLICQATLRESDLIARIGGEEFAILLPETDAQMAAEAVERIRESIAATDITLEDNQTFRITVSIGVVTLKEGTATLDTLLRLADAALYEAKRSGRNRICEAHW